ncbi:MAG: hypothetical protein JWP02_3765 [Acidimicrobiales bacterium]|nr:hypothetical protein [Acidimicrobiales bacterium]
MRRPLIRVAAIALAAVAATAGQMTLAGGVVGSGGVNFNDFRSVSFSNPTRITNRWFPLTPGTEFVLTGKSKQGGRLVPHRLVSTVTDLTKVVNGVRALVLWERDYTDGTLAESELAFFAQDDSGNVWELGEYPEEYRAGRFAGAPSTWVSGVAGARPGVTMRAAPLTGTSAYVQGYAPAIAFKDMGRVFATGQRTCVPVACYSNVLVVEEWNAYEPAEGHQLKYHAPGVGVVRVGAFDSTDQEALELTSLTHLGPAAMAAERAQVLQLDARAYKVAPTPYGTTSPAQRLGAAGQRSAVTAPNPVRKGPTTSTTVPAPAVAAPVASAVGHRYSPASTGIAGGNQDAAGHSLGNRAPDHHRPGAVGMRQGNH